MIEHIDTYKANYLFYFDETENELEGSQQSLLSSLNSCEATDEFDLSQSYWMPLSKSQVGQLDPTHLQPEIKKLELPQISQKHILHKKADIEDFKACQDSPTVLPAFLELYVKF